MKSINIHGNEYVTVAERVKEFHKLYPDGFITTEIIKLEKGLVVMKATVYPDGNNTLRFFTGHAYEIENSTMVNKTSYVENCESSCVGRCLGLLGLGLLDGIASADEVQHAIAKQDKPVNSEDHEKQVELGNMCLAMAFDNKEDAANYLQEISSFETTDKKTGELKIVKGKRSPKELTGKWLDITLKKVKNEYENNPELNND